MFDVSANKPHSPICRSIVVEPSPEIDTSDLEEHITLAVLKARRHKIAFHKRHSPRKYELAVGVLDLALESSSTEICSLLSKLGMAVGPKPP